MAAAEGLGGRSSGLLRVLGEGVSGEFGPDHLLQLGIIFLFWHRMQPGPTTYSWFTFAGRGAAQAAGLISCSSVVIEL